MLKRIIHNWERRLASRDNNRVVRPLEWGLDFLDHPAAVRPSRDVAQALAAAGNGAPTPGAGLEDEDAKRRLFQFNERAITDSDDFFRAIPIPGDYSFDGHWLSFPSPVATPFAENNTVYARYFPVESNKGGVETDVANARGRAVLVLPQWNADVEGHVGLCKLINRVGIASLRLSLPYQDRRLLAGFERADYLVSANVGRTLQACRQAVLDSRAAIDWLVVKGYTEIGILGTSIGSCIAFLTMVHDDRIKSGVFIHASSFFGDVVWKGITTAHVRQGLEEALSAEDVRKVWSAISPNYYAGKLARNQRKGILLSGKYDLSFTPDLTRLMHEEMDRHEIGWERKMLPCGHYTLGRTPFKFAAGFHALNFLRKNL